MFFTSRSVRLGSALLTCFLLGASRPVVTSSTTAAPVSSPPAPPSGAPPLSPSRGVRCCPRDAIRSTGDGTGGGRSGVGVMCCFSSPRRPRTFRTEMICWIMTNPARTHKSTHHSGARRKKQLDKADNRQHLCELLLVASAGPRPLLWCRLFESGLRIDPCEGPCDSAPCGLTSEEPMGLNTSRAGDGLSGGRTVNPSSLYSPFSLCSPEDPWVLEPRLDLSISEETTSSSLVSRQSPNYKAQRTREKNLMKTNPSISASRFPIQTRKTFRNPFSEKSVVCKSYKRTVGGLCHRPNRGDLLAATCQYSDPRTRVKTGSGLTDLIVLFRINWKGVPRGSKNFFVGFPPTLFSTRRGGPGFFQEIGDPLRWRHSRGAGSRGVRGLGEVGRELNLRRRTRATRAARRREP